MTYFRSIVMQLLFWVLLTTQAHSEHAEQISRISKTINSIYLVSAPQNPPAAKIISEILKKKEDTTKNLQSLTTQLDVAMQNQQDIMNHLKSKIPLLNNQSIEEKMRINFVDLRIDDAIVMLEVIKLSPELTLELLNNMREYAIYATDSSQSDDERRFLNNDFQNYKETIEYIQSITLIDGTKKISGGNLKITFGKGLAQTSVLNIKMPTIDPQSLGINELDLLSTSNAKQAITALEQSVATIKTYMAIASEQTIRDIEVLVLIQPYMLYYNFNLTIDARDLIMHALNGAMSDDDRDTMNTDLDYLKSAMQKIQTYMSLFGPITTGEGKITIQVGDSNLPETMLEIDLPATDIHLLGIDKFNIKTANAASEAFSSINNIMKNFVYYPTSCLNKHN